MKTYVKTGIRWNIPYKIAKFARPLPYFMKYAGSYYKTLSVFNNSRTNLNYLCWDIEKWEKKFKYKKSLVDNSDIMFDYDQEWNDEGFEAVKKIYDNFNKEMNDAYKQKSLKQYEGEYENYYSTLTKWEIMNTEINWGEIYEKYIKLANDTINNRSVLANYAVEICYSLYPKRSKLFLWVICEEGLFKNLEKNKDYNMQIPKLSSDTNEKEYLGRYYKMINLFDD